MYNAHNIQQFKSQVLSNFFEPLKFEIKENGKVVWYCCNNAFINKLVF